MDSRRSSLSVEFHRNQMHNLFGLTPRGIRQSIISLWPSRRSRDRRSTMSTQSQVSERISRSTIPLPVNTGNISGMNRMEEVPSSSIPHTSKSGSPSCDVTPSPTLTSPPSGKEIRKHLFKSIKDIRNIKNIVLLALYLGLCIIVGVIMGRAIEVVAENQSLFVARAIISASLAFPTLSLNKILDVFIRDQFDAGGKSNSLNLKIWYFILVICENLLVWARIIHKGKYGEKMTLKELSNITSSNLSLVSWFNLCRYRMWERDGQDKSIPKSYEYVFIFCYNAW